MFEDHLAADRGLNCKKRVDWAGEVCSPHTQEKKKIYLPKGEGKGRHLDVALAQRSCLLRLWVD